jgi:hypothetical protein
LEIEEICREARMSSICLSETLTPLVLMDCQAVKSFTYFLATARPASMPVTMPPTLLARADEVIA